MMLHSNAWADGVIVIIHKETNVTGLLEENLARYSPSIEPLIHTFNDPVEAVNFTRGRTNIRLCILSDNFDSVAGLSVCESISKQCQLEFLKPKFVLLHANSPDINVYRKICKMDDILDYLPVDALTDSNLSKQGFSQIWSNFLEATESEVVSEETAAVLFDCCGGRFDENFRSKYERIAGLITAQLNLSFRDTIVIKWYPYLEYVRMMAPESTASPISYIFRLYADACALSVSGDARFTRLNTFAKRIEQLVAFDQMSLITHLSEIKLNLRPSSSAIERTIARSAEKIISIAQTIDGSHRAPMSGVA